MDWLGTAFFGCCLAVSLWHSGGKLDLLVGFAGMATVVAFVSAVRSHLRKPEEPPSWTSRPDWVGASRQAREPMKRGGVLSGVVWAMALFWLAFGVREAHRFAFIDEGGWLDWLIYALMLGPPIVFVGFLVFVTLSLRRPRTDGPAEDADPASSFEVPVFPRASAWPPIPKPPVARRRVRIVLLSFAAVAVLLVWWCASSSPPAEPRSCDQVFAGAALRACETAVAGAVFDTGIELSQCASRFAGYWDYPLRCIETVAAAPVDVSGVVAACDGVSRMKSFAIKCVEAASISGGGAPTVERCSNQFSSDRDIVDCVKNEAEALQRGGQAAPATAK